MRTDGRHATVLDMNGDPNLKIGDAFGQVLSRCWRVGVSKAAEFEIVERDDGYIQANDACRYLEGRESWSRVERWGCDQVVGRVLDVGCGAGRHAVPLQAAGHDVVGLDPSPGAAAVARDRGVNVVEGTVADLGQDVGRFDTVIAMGNNLGLIEPGESGRRFLSSVASTARPGTRLIGSGIDPYATTTPEHLAYHVWNRDRGRLPGHVRIRVRDRCVATPWFSYVFRSPEEFADALAGTPWTLTQVERDDAAYCAVAELQS